MLGVVKYVYYSNDDGSITKENVSHMEFSHFSRGQRKYHKSLDDHTYECCAHK
jgi:hypothetical protein